MTNEDPVATVYVAEGPTATVGSGFEVLSGATHEVTAGYFGEVSVITVPDGSGHTGAMHDTSRAGRPMALTASSPGTTVAAGARLQGVSRRQEARHPTGPPAPPPT